MQRLIETSLLKEIINCLYGIKYWTLVEKVADTVPVVIGPENQDQKQIQNKVKEY